MPSYEFILAFFIGALIPLLFTLSRTTRRESELINNFNGETGDNPQGVNLKGADRKGANLKGADREWAPVISTPKKGQ